MATNNQTTITTADDVQLIITPFEAEQSNGRVVIINSAMGVHQRFYTKYAAYLAEQGFHAITYDYRGIGASCPGNLRGYEAYLWEWGAKDFTAVINWVETQYPDSTILVVGHSVGGQILGLSAKHTSIHGLYGVAAQSAYWGWWPHPGKWRVWAIWQAIPLVCLVFGYLPKQILGGSEDVPAGVAREWARGGRSRNYIVDVFRDRAYNYFGDVRSHMLLNCFTDDTLAPLAAVEALATLYPVAVVETLHIEPEDVYAPKIGHFGFFRSAFKASLWAVSADWLREV